jgi:predicted ATPase/DNA-binding winged helix-turn-helix (wHTH) protein
MTVYAFGACRLDPGARDLTVDGARVHLEPQVFDVLAYLVAHRDRMIPKAELLDAVWGNQFVTDSALASRVKSARAAIGDDGAAQAMIRTERGRGYRFVGAVETVDGAPFSPRWQPTGPLPPARAPLVGRVTDLDALDGLLGAHRVVTVTGPGGAGKSTLALEVARRAGTEVAFVALAPARDGTDVVRAVAEATGVEGAGDLVTLVGALGSRRLLLVLDNCEHLLDESAAVVDALLDAGADLRILVTSREPLGVDGEAVHGLGSLGADAATLFVQRATAATGRSTLTAADPAVVDLCHRLDGLPLAIELAAAQLRHLTLDDLLGRLDDRLGILVGGRPRAGERHATLARTIEWSYQLLSAPSRELFERLGVFPASFDLAAVEALQDGDAVALVADLVAKSLVVHEPSTGRYRLLETIRLFAWQRLDADRRADLTERVRRHVVARTTARPRAHGWLSASLAARNRDDLDNVRLAFDESVARHRFADAVDLAVGLSTLWRNAVSYAEGLRWVADLRGRDLAPRDRLWLHIVEADLGLGSGDPRLMADAAAAAEALAAGVDDPAAEVIATVYRSLSQFSQPDRAVAGLAVAAGRAHAAGEPGLHRLARAFRAVALQVTSRRDRVSAELDTLLTPVTDGYDRYICVWAGWVDALVDRDGPALLRWMDRQAENIHGSGLRENWVMLFCYALSRIADGSEYLSHLGRARHRAESEGRHADADCVLALAYAAACRDDPERAAELLGACGGGLFHDTANFIHYAVIRDRVVRPMLSPDTFETAYRRGADLRVATVLAEHGLGSFR